MALRGAVSGQLARSLRSAWGPLQSRALVTQSLPDLPYDYRCTLGYCACSALPIMHLPVLALWHSMFALSACLSRPCSYLSPYCLTR